MTFLHTLGNRHIYKILENQPFQDLLHIISRTILNSLIIYIHYKTKRKAPLRMPYLFWLIGAIPSFLALCVWFWFSTLHFWVMLLNLSWSFFSCSSFCSLWFNRITPELVCTIREIIMPAINGKSHSRNCDFSTNINQLNIYQGGFHHEIPKYYTTSFSILLLLFWFLTSFSNALIVS